MKRKHDYLPCGIIDDVDDLTDDEWKTLLKFTDWQKWITGSQWKDLLEFPSDGKMTPALSKLKRRVMEWQLMVWRIYDFAPTIVDDATEQAHDLRRRFNLIQEHGRKGLHMKIWDDEKKEYT